MNGNHGWLSLQNVPNVNAVRLEVYGSDLSCLMQVVWLVRRMLDLDADHITLLGRLDRFVFDLHRADGLRKIVVSALDTNRIADFQRRAQLDNSHRNVPKMMSYHAHLFSRFFCHFHFPFTAWTQMYPNAANANF